MCGRVEHNALRKCHILAGERRELNEHVRKPSYSPKRNQKKPPANYKLFEVREHTLEQTESCLRNTPLFLPILYKWSTSLLSVFTKNTFSFRTVLPSRQPLALFHFSTHNTVFLQFHHGLYCSAKDQRTPSVAALVTSL